MQYRRKLVVAFLLHQLKRTTFVITDSIFNDFKDGISIPSFYESLKQAPVAFHGVINAN